MNKENLQRMADYIRTVPQELFDMEGFRRNTSDINPECNSIGCVIGHCTALDPFNIPIKETHILGRIITYIGFKEWSLNFTGITSVAIWDYLFSPRWTYTDNTTKGAADRIEYVLKFGLPEKSYQEISGFRPLSYQKQPICPEVK